MFLVTVNKALESRKTSHSIGKPGLVVLTALLTSLVMPVTAQAACPDLNPYYQSPEQSQWPGPEVLTQLTSLMPECLDSTEYFALLGAAQLNSDRVPEALESLERALLVDPDNGAARVDYAQALYIAGQIFPALEINQSLLGRSDLPPNLLAMLLAREKEWQGQTRSRGLFAELSLGYDDNLNGAPSKNDFTLTLSGEPVSLALSSEYQPRSGPYLNLQFAGYYQRLDPEHSQDLQFGLRNRRSEGGDNELLQADWRYSYVLPIRRKQWEFSAGSSHLLYSGNPLYSVAEGRIRYRYRGSGCNPRYDLAAQHQLYHGQSLMTGIESSVTGGVDCASGNHRLSIEAGVLNNSALRDRPGADRQGWKLRLSWQLQLGPDVISAQMGYASLEDKAGYSPLLASGARRKVDSRTMQVQYNHPLQTHLSLTINLNHQDQGSNIDPFENHSTALEFGLRLNF